MIMSVDKSWLENPNRRSTEYLEGLNSFINRCKEHTDSRGYVRCACAKCENTLVIPFTTMKHHMNVWGICRDYKEWTYHGESLIPEVEVVDDVAPTNDTDMAAVIEDVMYERMEEDTDLNEGDLGTESSSVHDEFECLLKEAESELYPGCTKFSSLDFITKFMHIKVRHKLTNSCFDEILELLQASHPEGNKVPPSHYVAKKTLKKLGLGYESIHVCKNDCALFWAEHHLLQNCPVCNESRWVDPDTHGKKVPHKKLRYFPLTPRLRRLYGSRHTAKDMIWHHTGRSEDGTMRHPVDGTSWKEFDIKYPNFSREPRNVRLGLAADGFNPFGNMSSALSFCSMYLRDVQTKFNRPDRNEDVVVEKRKMWVFESKCRPASATKIKFLSPIEKLNLEWFVLDNCQEVREYVNEFKSKHPLEDVKTKFHKWFLEKVYSMKIQNSSEFHSELYALSMGADVEAATYTACIVNGVRFMVLLRDKRRTTQNSGVSTQGEHGEKYYGLVEEIIELFYANGYSTVLFRCKWFDTRMGVTYDNNITSINTEHEWCKEDQLIFASQAKQVFYVREPSRGNQINNHRWVVEDVNHRKIWDLPALNDGHVENVQNVNNDLAEDLDVVHNNSSSNSVLFIDFRQYFQNMSAHVTEGESAIEVNPPTVIDDEVSEVETDYDEPDPDYLTEGSDESDTSEGKFD
ncbi:putative Transposase-associated domain-containing protein [Helianthus annuus]|nr:putative Transposase-associated domain-containing protein [Helianthus annuus]